MATTFWEDPNFYLLILNLLGQLLNLVHDIFLRDKIRLGFKSCCGLFNYNSLSSPVHGSSQGQVDVKNPSQSLSENGGAAGGGVIRLQPVPQ